MYDRHRTLAATTALLLLGAALATGAGAEPGVERWIPVSTTAMAITGDIALSPSRITMAGKTFPLAVAADVPAFKSDLDGAVPARILRVLKPSNPVLLNGNRLCKASWIVVWRETAFGQINLDMAVFSGPSQPAAVDAPDLCGTFMYGRP